MYKTLIFFLLIPKHNIIFLNHSYNDKSRLHLQEGNTQML